MVCEHQQAYRGGYAHISACGGRGEEPQAICSPGDPLVRGRRLVRTRPDHTTRRDIVSSRASRRRDVPPSARSSCQLSPSRGVADSTASCGARAGCLYCARSDTRTTLSPPVRESCWWDPFHRSHNPPELTTRESLTADVVARLSSALHTLCTPPEGPGFLGVWRRDWLAGV